MTTNEDSWKNDPELVQAENDLDNAKWFVEKAERDLISAMNRLKVASQSHGVCIEKLNNIKIALSKKVA